MARRTAGMSPRHPTIVQAEPEDADRGGMHPASMQARPLEAEIRIAMAVPFAVRRILVIDDVPTNIALLTASLRRIRDVEVSGFTDAAAALVHSAGDPPDLVLVDYQMPGMDGVAFIQRFRRLHGCESTPIVVVTGEGDTGLLQKAFEAGANDFLRKPVDHVELTARAQNMLRLGETSRELYRLATQDDLTGLANRRHLLERLNHCLLRSHRHAEPLAFALFDIDHFKRINDDHGHEAGDAVLRLVSRRFREEVRDVDLWGRIGGEEFGLLLTNMKASDALRQCERVRSRIIGEPFALPCGTLISVSVSGGVTAARPGDSESRLMRRADHALYEAKRIGRDRIISAD